MVKYGNKDNSDEDFVIGEVSCDGAYFCPRGSGSSLPYVGFSRDKSRIGQRMRVNTVGRHYRQDVKDWYKCDEISRSERKVFCNLE